MSPIVIPSSPATDLEELTLNGLPLHTPPFFLESIDFGLPASLAEWIRGADSNGAILSRPPLYENRVIEAKVSVERQATMDAALAHIGTLVDKLQECAQNVNGLGLVWSPAESTLAAITFRCLQGEITDLPIGWESGYFAKAPSFTVKLTCLPFGEGVEYLAGSVTSSDIMQVLTLSGVSGDVSGLVRLVVTDAATQSRRYVAWGMESRWLPTTGAPSLIVDSAGMVTAGYAGVTATRSGAYSGATNNVISATLRTQVQAICGLGNLTHVGSFRPQLRFYASATTMAVRLTYQTLDGPFRSLSYKIPVAAGWNHVDLGLVSLPKTTLNAQRWTGRIEAYSTATGGEVFQADVVCMVPAELYGRASATYVRPAGVLNASDDFTGTTAGAGLDGRALPIGTGSWVSSGAVADFTFQDDPLNTGLGEHITRQASSDASERVAEMGSATFTDVVFAFNAYFDTYGSTQMGAIVRYVDANNYLRCSLQPAGTGPTMLDVKTVVAGAATQLINASIGVTLATKTIYRVTLVVHASGRGILTVSPANTPTAILAQEEFASAALATGGALASGKNRLLDYNPGAVAVGRRYDAFYVETPPAEPIALYSGQSIEFSSTNTLREDATGTYAGPPPEYVGSRFFVPPAGGTARQTRIAVMAKRNDVTATVDDFISDSLTVQAYVTPRYLVVPR